MQETLSSSQVSKTPARPANSAAQVATTSIPCTRALANSKEARHPQVAAGGAVVAAADDRLSFWITTISRDVQNTTGWIVQTGTHLLAAKQELGHGSWCRMFEDGKLPMSARSAEMLMRIAGHKILTNPKTFRMLPTASTVLYHLSRVEPQTVQQGIEDGRIHPGLTLQEAKEFVRASQGQPPTLARTPPAFDAAKELDKLRMDVLDRLGKWPVEFRSVISEMLREVADEILHDLKAGDAESASDPVPR